MSVFKKDSSHSGSGVYYFKGVQVDVRCHKWTGVPTKEDVEQMIEVLS